MIGISMVGILFCMGRTWWCPQKDWLPWSLDIWSAHNSQHLFDAYSLSHLQHGFGLFILLKLISSKKLTDPVRVIIVATVEAAWEILENTPLIINRYREATISLDYYGDSILNSISDYGMCLIGVFCVRKVGWKIGLFIFVCLELFSLWWVKDSLMINIIMLIAPNDAIREWQST